MKKCFSRVLQFLLDMGIMLPGAILLGFVIDPLWVSLPLSLLWGWNFNRIVQLRETLRFKNSMGGEAKAWKSNINYATVKLICDEVEKHYKEIKKEQNDRA